MATTTRLATLSLLVLLLSFAALPAFGAETEEGDDEGLGTTDSAEVVEFEYQPAVILEPPPADPAEEPWTTKFLVPTGLALAAVAVFVTVVQYFVRVVRSRYKVVE